MERHYYTYLIEEEFASHYFGRESVMFKLFYDYHWTSPDQKSQLAAKQIEFITKPIPVKPYTQKNENEPLPGRLYTG